MSELVILAEIQGEIAECRRCADQMPARSRLRWIFSLLADDLERWARDVDETCLATDATERTASRHR